MTVSKTAQKKNRPREGSCPLCLRVYDFNKEVVTSKRGNKGWRFPNGYPCWDHCHDCGEFRGWLCNGCNALDGLIISGVARVDNLPGGWFDRWREYIRKCKCYQSYIPRSADEALASASTAGITLP